MNTLQVLCPKCNKHTEIELENNIIHINCLCGYYSKMNIENCKINQSTINDEAFKVYSK